MTTEIKMKIAVVSTGRSRCTLLAKYLHTLHNDLEFCGEFYNAARDDEGNPVDPGLRGADDQQPKSMRNLTELTDELFAKENYVVKIMGLDAISEDLSAFRLEEYDELHFIERYDFFEQCCSWQVSRQEQLYHQRPDDPRDTEKAFAAVRRRRYRVTTEEIRQGALFAYWYLRLKRYVTDNNLPYTLHTFESAKMFDKKQSVLTDTKLNYSELIINYHVKEEVNALFNKYFSYDSIHADLTSFTNDLNEIKGLRSIQSFADKMAAKWNK
jgi:hypothetical protein